ncbi:MAG: acyl-CoA dehydrogenase family protein [Solirubrobacteraceae bacterium]|nr:acyl-CoA dehydrogenase family protein [Solirubrobacteraceae bacterium]
MAVALSERTDKETQEQIVELVRQFTDEQILPNAEKYDHADEYPQDIVDGLKELGIFGATIPEEYGGLGLDLSTYTRIVVELARGWISIPGVVNTHFIGAYLLMRFGTEEQKQKYLPRMATGEITAAFSLSEPHAGSDVQAIKTTAKKVGDDYELNGAKMWLTNGLTSGLVFTLVVTDTEARPRYKGMTCFILEKEPGVSENTGQYAGLTIPPKIKKMGYKGVESTEMVLDGYKTSGEQILGGEEVGLNGGFKQMMDALEVGRVNVAARGVGLAQRALELALRYSQERETFGKPIAEHQMVQGHIADMAARLEGARLLTYQAAELKDEGKSSNLEAAMAKMVASEAGHANTEACLRLHGGYGYSKEYEVERLYRDAPLLLIGEGTSDIQRLNISKQLLKKYKI